MRTGIMFALLVAGILIAGCVGGQSPRPPASAPADTPLIVSWKQTPVSSSGTSGQPSVFIITPAFDAGIPAGNVTISVEVKGIDLVRPGGKNIPGTGHLIYYRDVVHGIQRAETREQVH